MSLETKLKNALNGYIDLIRLAKSETYFQYYNKIYVRYLTARGELKDNFNSIISDFIKYDYHDGAKQYLISTIQQHHIDGPLLEAYEDFIKKTLNNYLEKLSTNNILTSPTSVSPVRVSPSLASPIISINSEANYNKETIPPLNKLSFKPEYMAVIEDVYRVIVTEHRILHCNLDSFISLFQGNKPEEPIIINDVIKGNLLNFKLCVRELLTSNKYTAICQYITSLKNERALEPTTVSGAKFPKHEENQYSQLEPFGIQIELRTLKSKEK